MVRLIAELWERDGAPEPGGAVRSVFDRGCHLRDDTGRLVPITDRAAGVLPGGLRVRLPAGLRFPSLLRTGARAATRGGVLRFEGGLAVDLRTARPWGPMRRRRLSMTGIVPVRDALRHARRRLREAARDRAPGILALTGRAGSSPADLPASAARLIGRGPGLTPAGDDYVVGLSAGLHVLESAASADARNALRASIAVLARNTTDVSRALLDGAGRGVFPERLADLSDSVLRPSPAAEIDRAVRALAALGHSSGLSMGLGFAAGLAIGLGERTGRAPSPADPLAVRG